MVFNFKNKNIKIILLVLLVLASVACYSMMRRDVEGLGNMSSHFETNFKIYNKDYKNGTDNYFLKPYAANETEIKFSTDTPLSSLSGTVISKEDVNKNGGIYKYMIKNGYDMYRLTTATTPGTVESYEVYKIDIPFTINLLDADAAIVDSVVDAAIVDSVVDPAVDETVVDSVVDEAVVDSVVDETTTVRPRLTGSPAATPEQLAEIARLKALETSQTVIVETTTLSTTLSIAETSIEPVKIEKLKVLISGDASIAGSANGPVLPSNVITTLTPATATEPTFLKIDIVVPIDESAAMITKLNDTWFSSILIFNAAINSQAMSGITAEAIPVPIAVVIEPFGNMMSYFFGKKVKEGMTGLTYRGNVLLRLREGDYSNVLTKSGETLDITMKKSNIVLIQNGGLLVKPQNYVAPPVTPPKDNGGQTTYIKDENGLYVAVNSQATNSCLIPGSDPALVTNNKCPFYPDTSMFETAMNNPSNPIVNPVNSMSPVDYSQTLFGPHATGVAANTPCSSCNNNQVPAATNTNSCSSNNVARTTDVVVDDVVVDDATVNDLVDNPSIVPAVPTTPDATNAPNVPNVFNQINSAGNRMMAQNGNDGNGAGNAAAAATSSYSDFNGAGNMNPSMARTDNIFPEYVPNLNDNNAEPRPVLANFSSFGS